MDAKTKTLPAQNVKAGDSLSFGDTFFSVTRVTPFGTGKTMINLESGMVITLADTDSVTIEADPTFTTYTTPAKDDRSAVRRVLLAMDQQGAKWTTLENGGDDDETVDLANITLFEVMKEVQQTDSDFIHFEFEGDTGWILFVYGNEPYEVVANAAPYEDGSEIAQMIERATNPKTILIDLDYFS